MEFSVITGLSAYLVHSFILESTICDLTVDSIIVDYHTADNGVWRQNLEMKEHVDFFTDRLSSLLRVSAFFGQSWVIINILAYNKNWNWCLRQSLFIPFQNPSHCTPPSPFHRGPLHCMERPGICSIVHPSSFKFHPPLPPPWFFISSMRVHLCPAPTYVQSQDPLDPCSSRVSTVPLRRAKLASFLSSDRWRTGPWRR